MNASDLNQHDIFMKLFLENQRGLLRYVMCLIPNANDAREIVHNTSIALWRKIDQYDPEQPFMRWACQFALIETKEFLRTQVRWRRFLDDDVVHLLLSRRMEMSEELDERRIHLRECLRKLPETQRKVVEHYYFDDRPIEQLAAASNISADAVYKSLQRIRAALMECIRRQQQLAIGDQR